MKEILLKLFGGSGRRLIVLILGALAMLLTRYTGIDVDPVVLDRLADLVMVYLVAGNAKEAAMALAKHLLEKRQPPTLGELAGANLAVASQKGLPTLAEAAKEQSIPLLPPAQP